LSDFVASTIGYPAVRTVSASGGYAAINHFYIDPTVSHTRPAQPEYCTAFPSGVASFMVSIISVDSSNLYLYLTDGAGAPLTGTYSVVIRVAGS
jgi:hypothetical protein